MQQKEQTSSILYAMRQPAAFSFSDQHSMKITSLIWCGRTRVLSPFHVLAWIKEKCRIF